MKNRTFQNKFGILNEKLRFSMKIWIYKREIVIFKINMKFKMENCDFQNKYGILKENS